MIRSDHAANKSPLEPLVRSPSQVALEVVFIRSPREDEQLVADVWDEVDELAVAADDRRRLWRNGFRCGTIGSQLPPRVAEILKDAESLDGAAGHVDTIDPDRLTATRRHIYLQNGQRGEVVAGSVLPQFHVLYNEGGEVHGETFEEGQAQFAVVATIQDDGRVRLKLIPELHHGQYRQRYVPGEGMFRLETGRDKRVFDPLQLTATLAEGQILVLGSAAPKAGSLGYRFFHESPGDKPVTKLLIVRVAPTGNTDRHAADRQGED